MGLRWTDRGLYVDGDGKRIGAVRYDVAPGRKPTGMDWCAIYPHRSIGRHATEADARAQVEQAYRDYVEALRAAHKR